MTLTFNMSKKEMWKYPADGAEIGSWFTYWARGNNKYCASPGYGGTMTHLHPVCVSDGMLVVKFSIIGKVRELEIPVPSLDTPLWSMKMAISEWFWNHEEEYMAAAGYQQVGKFWSKAEVA
jgi:hypothetical protein